MHIIISDRKNRPGSVFLAVFLAVFSIACFLVFLARFFNKSQIKQKCKHSIIIIISTLQAILSYSYKAHKRTATGTHQMHTTHCTLSVV